MTHTIPILDMSRQIAALPRRAGHQTHPARTRVRWTTLHYSAVNYKDRSPAAERARVLNEARHHLGKNWGTAARPAYGDALMYDLVVLSDGVVVTTGPSRQLWHCGNATGNRESWSVHVMLGKEQPLTPPQRDSLFAVFERLALPVVAHCEWPRGDGPPRPSPAYAPLPGQSECPGRLLHGVLAAWRAGTAPSPIRTYRAKHTAYVRADHTTASPRLGTVKRGSEVHVVRVVDGERLVRPIGASDQWAERAEGGYVWLPQLEVV